MEIKNVTATTRPLRVAAASYEGVLVNQHLGMAESLSIFEVNAEGIRLVGKRSTPPPGNGIERWQTLAKLIGDCNALLVNSLGDSPLSVLTSAGIKVYEVEGLIEDALHAIYEGRELHMPYRRRSGCRCSGSAQPAQGCG